VRVKRRLVTALGLGLVLLATPAAGRIHRIHLPPASASLPRSLAVDETEYTLRPSHTVLAAGAITVNVYNRGMDPHELQFEAADGRIVGAVAVPVGGAVRETVALAPGRYRLVCDLYAGTPQSHEMLGMHALVTVR
jgi:plastocyanin